MAAATSSLDLQALRNEVVNDPLKVGYADSNKDPTAVSNQLNLRSGVGSGTILRNDVQAKEIFNSIDPTDFAALSSLQLQKLQFVLSQGSLDATGSNLKTLFVGVFSGMQNTINNINALVSRVGSRAEVLFGAGTVVGFNDITLSTRLT